jgi:hypothetical protein
MVKINMKKNNWIILILSLIILSASSCESTYYDHRLKLYNNSEKTLYATYYQSFPDTALGQHSFSYSPNRRINPGETFTLSRGGTWETAFKEQINEKLMIFVFDANVVENTPWDTIRKNYIILKRYDLSLEDLERLDWMVTYP